MKKMLPHRHQTPPANKEENTKHLFQPLFETLLIYIHFSPDKVFCMQLCLHECLTWGFLIAQCLNVEMEECKWTEELPVERN